MNGKLILKVCLHFRQNKFRFSIYFPHISINQYLPIITTNGNNLTVKKLDFSHRPKIGVSK